MIDALLNTLFIAAGVILLLPFVLVLLVIYSYFKEEWVHRRIIRYLMQFDDGDLVDYNGKTYYYRGEYYRGGIFLEEVNSLLWCRVDYDDVYRIKCSKIRQTPLWKKLVSTEEEANR